MGACQLWILESIVSFQFSVCCKAWLSVRRDARILVAVVEHAIPQVLLMDEDGLWFGVDLV